jgi:hypothetical protein
MIMEPVADEYTCFIESTADPKTGKAACLMRWGRIAAFLPPDEVLTTARHLTAAATAAETDIAMIRAFRKELIDPNTVGQMVLDVRRHRPAPEGTAALRISAVAGAKTCRPYVHIARGSNKGELTPDGARAMAQHWTEAAVAAQIDVRLRYALGEWGHLTRAQIEELFALVQKVQR